MYLLKKTFALHGGRSGSGGGCVISGSLHLSDNLTEVGCAGLAGARDYCFPWARGVLLYKTLPKFRQTLRASPRLGALTSNERGAGESSAAALATFSPAYRLCR